MKLPSIDERPVCSEEADQLFRSEIEEKPQRQYTRVSRSVGQRASRRVSVHDRLGPRCDEEQEFDEEFNHCPRGRFVEDNQWCPSGLFNKTQKRRIQRMRCKELGRVGQGGQ